MPITEIKFGIANRTFAFALGQYEVPNGTYGFVEGLPSAKLNVFSTMPIASISLSGMALSEIVR